MLTENEMFNTCNIKKGTDKADSGCHLLQCTNPKIINRLTVTSVTSTQNCKNLYEICEHYYIDMMIKKNPTEFHSNITIIQL
jgi:hypothetical protein